MAERRMFAKTIVLSDAFLDLPMSARCLYFTLGMVADDDGFVNSPRSIMRQVGASDDDMKVLIAKRFVLIFDSGVIVIKHWRMNNYLRSDRYTETKYTEEKSQLTLNQNGAYHLQEVGIPPGTPSMGIPSIGKDRLDKDSIGQSSKEQESKGECEGERKPFGKFVRLTDKEFASLLRHFGTSEFYRRKDAVDKEENEGKDFAQLIRGYDG